MLRVLCAGALSAVVLALMAQLPHVASPAAAGLPPAQARPPWMKPGTVWLPELPQYQYARREAAKQGLDFATRVDLSTTQGSRDGRYRISVRERPEPLKLEEFQSWSLHVEDAGHHPVRGATLTVNGGMPQHGHGLPARPKISELASPGDYRVDGLQFSMPGWWEIKVYVSKDRVEDTATFNVILQ